MTDELNLEPEFKPVTQEVADAISAVVGEIQGKSFSERHPELGKMIKCQVCRSRHRASLKCEQRFAEDYILEDLETGEKITVYRTAIPEGKKGSLKQIIGAAAFKGKRLNPHPSWRANQFVELVRNFLPDEYTQDELKKARTRARFVLAGRYGRHGFMRPIWQHDPKEKEQPTA